MLDGPRISRSGPGKERCTFSVLTILFKENISFFLFFCLSFFLLLVLCAFFIPNITFSGSLICLNFISFIVILLIFIKEQLWAVLILTLLLSYLSLIFAFSLIFVFPSLSFLWLFSILFLISCLAN